MSATPRIYELEDDPEDDQNNPLFGDTIYNMTFTDAIEKKYITDYLIWLPSIHEDLTQLQQELSIYDIDNVIKSKCIFLFSCLINNGSKKCIIYCIDTNEIALMKSAIDRAKQKGCKVMELNTETTNDVANNLYKGLGFELKGLLDDYNNYQLVL